MTEYMGLEAAQAVASLPETLAAEIGIPYGDWSGKCHEVSKRLLDAGRFGPGRIARGWAPPVIGQHSWMVLSHDVYDRHAIQVDPTIVPYLIAHGLKELPEFRRLPAIVVAHSWHLTNTPHGAGSIWENHERPRNWGGPTVELTPARDLSSGARRFLEVLGPLDHRGWMQLANGPMQGWPAGEIIAAMDDTKALVAVVPIDILGMLTDRNPAGRYLQELKAAS